MLFKILYRKILITAILMSALTSAFAWGPQGHQAAAGFAYSLLSETAKRNVQLMLAQEPGQTFVSISTWADEQRTKENASWHFINFPKNSCSYVKDRDCAGGQCAIAAIEEQVGILSNTSNSPAIRLKALKFIVHLVTDIHQPLHAGFSEDKGGNQYPIQFANKSSNLHALWDVGMIDALGLSVDELISRLAKMQIASLSDPFDAVAAALESCQIVHQVNFYPSHSVHTGYIEQFTPVLETRLATAGIRLALLLNQVLKQ